MRARIAEPRIRLFIVLACLAVLLPACNRRAKEHMRLQKEWNAKYKEMADHLASINDAASARAAEPKLHQALLAIEKINEKLESYDPENVDSSQSQAMTEAVAEGIVETQRVLTESLRISRIPGVVSALGDTWKKLPASAMLEARGAMPRSK